MTKHTPKLGIGIPVYNGERFLRAALDALLAQTFQDFEIIICDNASTDGTAAICEEYAARDPRIQFFRNEKNIGASPNFNRVLELSSAPYFRWASDDDSYEPTCMERCIEILDRDPSVVLAYTRLALIDEKDRFFRFDERMGKYISEDGVEFFDDEPNLAEGSEPEDRFRDVLKKVSACQQIHGVMRREALFKTRLYRNYYGADKVILAEMALLGRFCQAPEKLHKKRVHGGMSFFLTTKEKRAWAGATNPMKGIPQIYMICDYLSAVWKFPLTFGQRVRGTLAIMSLFRREGLWKRIFVPGPENYLGLNFGSRAKQAG